MPYQAGDKPTGYGIGDLIKGEAQTVGKGIKAKYQSTIDDALGDMPEDASAAQKTGRVLSWAGKKIRDHAKNKVSSVREQYTPASLEERSVPGYDAEIGSALVTPVGRARAKACQGLIETLASY